MPERQPPAPDPGAPLRAQILATEHWALLAARTTTQNEVLARIALLLTVLSAGLVTVGLLGQVTGFGPALAAAAFGIDAFVWLVGVLTLLRVLNASSDDAALVLGMNRIRAAYVELDGGVERWFVESAHDDAAGLGRTYFPLGRSDASQALASSAVFMILITSVLTGLLLATGLLALDVPVLAAVLAGLLLALASAVLVAAVAGRQVGALLQRWTPLRPTPSPAGSPARAAPPQPEPQQHQADRGDDQPDRQPRPAAGHEAAGDQVQALPDPDAADDQGDQPEHDHGDTSLSSAHAAHGTRYDPPPTIEP